MSPKFSIYASSLHLFWQASSGAAIEIAPPPMKTAEL